MMCFRDKTFCIANCKTNPCHDKLTDEVKDAAERWWGNDEAPIAVSDFSKVCEDYQENKND